MTKLNMRVIIVQNDYNKQMIGGTSAAARNMQLELQKKNISVAVLALPMFIKKIESIFNFFYPLKKLVHYFFVLIFIIISVFIIGLSRIYYKRVIVHSNNANFCLFIGVLGRLLGCKTVHTFRTFDIPTPPKFLIKRIDLFTCVGRDLKNFFRDERYKKINILYTPNGVDIKRFKPISLKKKIDLRKKLNLPENKFIMIYAARLNPHKKTEGVLLLLDSLSMLKNNNILFLIIGDGDCKRSIETYASNLGLSNLVRIMPLTVHLREYFQSSDIYVESPSCPNQSISSLEAMACGLPVINCVTSGGEALISGHNGLICKPNLRSIAKAITFLKKNPMIRRTYSKNAVNRISQNFTWAEVIQNYLRIYESLF